MNAATFGAFPAAGALVDLLDNHPDPRTAAKVSRLLQDFNAGLGHIAAVSHAGYRGRLALLWRDDFLRRVAIDPVLDKFVRNVICTHAKRLLAPDEAE